MIKHANSKWVKWVVAGISLVAFCMMFAPQMKSTLGFGTSLVWPFQPVLFGGKFNGQVFKGSVGGCIGYFTMLAGGLLVGAMGCTLSTRKRLNFIFTLLGSVIILVGVFLVFNTVTFWIKANYADMSQVHGSFKMSIGEIVGGIFGIFGVLCGFYAICLDYSK